MLTAQDYKIIKTILSEGACTAYLIAKETKISVTQVQYRLEKLVDTTLVTRSNSDNRTLYDTHPLLLDGEKINQIGERITEIVELIDTAQYTPLTGVQHILVWLINYLEEFEEIEDNST